MSRHRVTRGILLAVLAVAAVLCVITPAAFAASGFTGGCTASIDYPHYVANDHSVYSLRFTTPTTATGLAANSTYYVKVRFLLTAGSPNNPDNRGFIWNGSSHLWVPQSDNTWADFPTVTTDANGAIWDGSTAGQSPWYSVKFGDMSVTGDRYLCISLSLGGAGGTFNSSVEPAVTIFDPATAGYWVHNRATTTETGNKRVELSDSAAPGSPFALLFSEKNTVDDNADGTSDNEGQALYGPGADTTGDFRMAMPITSPTAAPFWLLFQKNVSTKFISGGVPWGQNFLNTTPDVDLALDATGDTTAPTAPANVQAATGNGSVTLTWDAATDAGGPVDHYIVYRWSANAPANASPVKTAIATVLAAGTLTFTDSSIVAGTQYSYEVRAEDGQTNVGPRSTTVQATPSYATAVTLDPLPATFVEGSAVDVTGSLAYGPGSLPMGGRTVIVDTSTNGSDWGQAGTATTSGAGAFTLTNHPAQKTWYRARFAAASGYDASQSTAGSIDIQYLSSVTLSVSDAAPAMGDPISISGTLTATTAGTALAGQSVTVQFSTNDTDWNSLGTTTTATDGSFSLPDTPLVKTWYRVAFAGTTQNAAATSGESSVTPGAWHTMMSLGLSAGTVNDGDPLTVTGILTYGPTAEPTAHRLAGETVTFQASTNHFDWSTIGTATTDADGKATCPVDHLWQKTWFRVEYEGTADYAAPTIPDGSVNVLHQTLLSMTAPAQVNEGWAATLTGTLKYVTGATPTALAGETVAVESSANGTDWALLATVTSAADGSCTYTDHPTQRTWYRMSYAGVADLYVPKTAPESAVDVRYGTALSLADLPASVADGGTVTLAGSLAYGLHDLPLSGQAVAVESSPDGTTWTKLGDCTAGAAAGAYTYAARPAEKTWYRLSYAGATSYAAGVTAPQAVVVRHTTSLALAPTPTVVDYGAKVSLSGTLSRSSSGAALAGQPVFVESSPDGSTWSRLGDCTAGATSGTYALDVHPTVKTWYRLRFAGATDYAASSGDPRVVTPRLQGLGTPVAVATIGTGKTLTVSGTIKPKQTAGARVVRVQCYQRSGAKWVLKKTVTATVTANGTKYSVRLTLARTGSWKLRAYYAESSSYAATWSGYRAIRVTR